MENTYYVNRVADGMFCIVHAQTLECVDHGFHCAQHAQDKADLLNARAELGEE